MLLGAACLSLFFLHVYAHTHRHRRNMITIPGANWFPGFVSAPSARGKFRTWTFKVQGVVFFVFFKPSVHYIWMLYFQLLLPFWFKVLNEILMASSAICLPTNAVTCQPYFFFFFLPLVRTRNILDDFREAYYWLRQNTDEHARVMSWWDYGYQIAGMANRTTLVDNNTWNNSHIALVRAVIVFLVFICLLPRFARGSKHVQRNQWFLLAAAGWLASSSLISFFLFKCNCHIV